MQKTKRLLLFVVLSIACGFESFSQSTNNLCPPNFDAEMGNFTNWNSSVGTVATGPIYFLTPMPGATPTRQDITPTGYSGNAGLDPYGFFPVICPAPNGGNYSIKLGNSMSGSECEQVKYQLHVPSTNSDYNMTFNYAVVFEDPSSHLPQEKPQFSVKVYDSATNQIIPCATFNFTAGSTMSGFLLSPVSVSGSPIYYKPWSSHYMSLHNMQGHTVTLEFTTNDCTLGGHFGYAYIDFSSQCDSTRLIGGYCLGVDTGTLIAPPGFQSYSWYDTNYVLLDTGQIIGINQFFPQYYHLVVNPFAGYGCVDTFYSIVTVMPKPVANFGLPSHYCAGSIVLFTDSSYSPTAVTYISSWLWDFGDTSLVAPNLNTSTLQNPTHVYVHQGTYHVTLQVWNTLSCVSDTIIKTIIINQPPPPLAVVASNDTVCSSDSVTFTFNGPVQTGYTYVWNLNSNTNLLSGNLNSSNPISVKFNLTGTNYVGFTAIPPVGDTTCWAHLDYPIVVSGLEPFFFITGLDSICPNQNDTLSISNIPPNCGASTSTCSGNLAYDLGFLTSPNMATVPTPFQGAFTEGRCQLLFHQTEIIASGFINGGVISDIGWEILSKNSSAPYQNFTIKMACVPYNSFTTGQIDKTTPLTVVYTNAAYNSVIGLNNFSLTTPYNWDGVSDLLIDICYDNGTFNATGDDRVKKSTAPVGQNLCMWARSDNDALVGCDPNYPSTALVTTGTERPDIIFRGCYGNTNLSTNYTWSSSPAGLSSNSNSVVVNPSTTTTYTATATNGGCSKSQSFVVNMTNQLNVDAGTNQTICNSNSANLTAIASGSGVFNYLWSSNPTSTITNPTAPSITVTPTVTTTYYVSVSSSLGNCVGNDSVIVTVVNAQNMTHHSDTTVCKNASVNLWAAAAGVCGTCWQWTSSANNSLSCSTCANPILTASVNDMVIVTGTSANGCIATDTIYITVNALPVATFSATDTICINSLSTIVYTGNAPASANYNWNFNGGSFSPSTMTQGPYTVSWNTIGIKTITLTVTSNGCSNTTTQNILVNPTPLANLSMPNSYLCGNDTIQISASGSVFSSPASFNYTFQNGTPATAITTNSTAVSVSFPAMNNTYTSLVTLQISASGCLSGIDSALVTVYSLPVANAGNDLTIFPGNTTILNGSGSFGGNSFLWTPASYLNSASISNPAATPPYTMNFILTYSNNPAGCSDKDTMTVSVVDTRQVIIPNSFSPNSDGKNDYFMIMNAEKFERIDRFEIYNRWGQLVYSTTDKASKGWDGSYNGEPQPIDTYVYHYQLSSGKNKPITGQGNVTLVR